MQHIRRIELQNSGLVGFGVHSLLVSAAADCQQLVARISGLGSSVEIETDLYRAVERFTDETGTMNICMIDCDSFGGLSAGHKFVQFVGRAIDYVPVILMSAEITTQYFSEHHSEPTLLRLPLSPVAARVGFEHSLRDRFVLNVC